MFINVSPNQGGRMLKSGLVIELYKGGTGGIIEDNNREHYLFSVKECIGGVVPKLHSTVTFRRDMDYKFTKVASLVASFQLKREA